MTTKTAPDNLDELLGPVIERAQHDPEFRSRCVVDPQGGLKEVTGYELADKTLRFVDGNAADLTIVLPPTVGRKALGDAELDQVAGGIEPLTSVVICSAAIGGLSVAIVGLGALAATGAGVIISDLTGKTNIIQGLAKGFRKEA